jgi:putative ABC transport system permease protein
VFATSSFARLRTALGTALGALLRHPLRGALTALGVLVGVAAVTTVVTLGEGAERAVAVRIERLGEDLLTVFPRAAEASGVPGRQAGTLREEDARALASEVEGALEVAPVLDGLARAVRRERNATVSVVGTDLDYFSARGYRVLSGSLWLPSDQATSARVVLVGPTVVTELFGDVDPVGETLRIGRHLFRIVGTLEEKGQTPFGMDQDNVVVMPIGALRSKILAGGAGEVSQILVRADPAVGRETVRRGVEALLRQRHGIAEGGENDFAVRDQARIAEAQRGVVGVMRMLLLAIAAVSLAIGGIGVMNIMLVSVAERSREIGTRLAVGARASDILVQFLVESVVLCLLGGGAGALLSGLLVAPLEAYFGWELALSPSALLIASVVSVTTGVVFGLLPARRAARLDPVEALRRE